MQYVRMAEAFRPRVLVMENVTGLVKGDMKPVFARIMAELRGRGYRVKAQILNAMHFGVPQARERVIFVGVREDLKAEPSHPRPETKPVSCSAAVRGLEIDETERAWLLECGLKYAAYKSWAMMKPGDHGDDVTGKNGFSSIKYEPHRPAPTIPKNDGNVTMHGGMHWAERRRFTVAEYRRFSSFPDSFAFPRTGDFRKDWSGAVMRIGNSVPPLLMRAIATHIKTNILGMG